MAEKKIFEKRKQVHENAEHSSLLKRNNQSDFSKSIYISDRSVSTSSNYFNSKFFIRTGNRFILSLNSLSSNFSYWSVCYLVWNIDWSTNNRSTANYQ